MQNVTATNLQTNLKGEELKNTLGTQEGKIMCSIVKKEPKTDHTQQVNSLQAEYERVLSNNVGKKVMCTVNEEKANSIIDNTPYNTILSPTYPTTAVNHLFAPQTNFPAPMPELKHAHSPDNIAETVKRFDEEQKDLPSKNSKLLAFNNVLAKLAKPKKIFQHDIMQKFINLVPTITQQGKVFIYNGTFYEMAKLDLVKRKIVELFRQEIKDKSASYVNGIYQFLKIEPSIAVSDEAIRRDLLTFNNCVLNLTTGETYDLSPHFITTYQIRANYLPNSNLPTYNFDNFLNKVTGGDSQLAQRILEIIGYCLTPDTSGKVFFLYQGLGDTGKSILARLMQMLFTPEAVYPMKAENLRKPFSMGELYNRAFCVCNDMSADCLDDKTTSTLKELTGRDLISSSVKYAEDIVFSNYSKILVVTNHALKTKTPDIPFFRRVICVPFKFPVAPHEIDVHLPEKLWQERDGIATAAISAYWQLKNRNYVFSGYYEPNLVVVHEESTELDVESNIVKYLNENFEVEDAAITFIEDAYNDYLKNNPPLAMNVFSPHFKFLASEIFDAKEDRKRRHSGANAQSCVIGIKFKGM